MVKQMPARSDRTEGMTAVVGGKEVMKICDVMNGEVVGEECE